jgi:hypothetical protein
MVRPNYYLLWLNSYEPILAEGFPGLLLLFVNLPRNKRSVLLREMDHNRGQAVLRGKRANTRGHLSNCRHKELQVLFRLRFRIIMSQALVLHPAAFEGASGSVPFPLIVEEL